MLTSAVRGASIFIAAIGFFIVGVGAVLLKRLDEHAYGDPTVFYNQVERYGAIATAGAFVCFVGVVGLAAVLEYRTVFRAAICTGIFGIAHGLFGLFFFPIHNASGRVYVILLGLIFGSGAAFLLVASAKYASYRIQQGQRR